MSERPTGTGRWQQGFDAQVRAGLERAKLNYETGIKQGHLAAEFYKVPRRRWWQPFRDALHRLSS